jgi:hypothetical protein
MTDREKLLELLNKAHTEYYTKCDFSKSYMETLADYLLANGVTFVADTNDGSKWISVDDRLPKCDCLAYSSKSGLMTVGYIEPHWHNGGTEYICANGLEPLFDVTHWTPLPEPPKEEGA